MSERAEEEIIEWLEKTPRHRLPGFVDFHELPEISFVSGRVLRGSALLGLLAQLRQESDQTPNDKCRERRAAFERTSLERFGLTLHAAWERAGAPSQHRWASEQRAITVSTQWLYTMGLQLHQHYQQHPQAGKKLIKLFARHGSKHAHAWLWFYCKSTHGNKRFREEVCQAVEELCARHRWEFADLPSQLHDLSEEFREHSLFYPNPAPGPLDPPLPNEQFELYQTQAAQPGEIMSALVFGLPTTLPENPHKDLRKALHTQNRYLKDLLNTFQLQCQQLKEQTQNWSVPHWRSLCVHHPILNKASQALIFSTDDDTHFCKSVHHQPLNVEGAHITLDGEARLKIVPWHTLPPDLQQRWAALLQTQPHPQTTPTPVQDPPLCELRDFLYEPLTSDSWSVLCDLIENIPDETVEVALEYTTQHLNQSPPFTRLPPPHWFVNLLDPQNEWRLHLEQIGQHLQGQRQPRLKICDTLDLLQMSEHFPKALKLREPDALNIAQATELSNIQTIDASEIKIFAKADPILSKHNPFPQLNTLKLRSANLRNKGWQGILASPWGRQCISLDLSHHPELDFELLVHALQENIWNQLETLDLSYSNWGDEFLGLLLLYPPPPHLKHLHLEGATFPSPRLPSRTLSRPTLPHLRTLNLTNTWLQDEGLRHLMQLHVGEHLEHLSLQNCDLTDESFEWIANTHQLQQLKRLHLNENAFTNLGLEALASASLPSLEELVLGSPFVVTNQGVQYADFSIITQSNTLPQKALLQFQQTHQPNKA